MEAMKRGETWALPRKDQGPVRALARDYVDARRSISEYYMFGILVLVVLLFTRRCASRPSSTTSVLALLLVILVESYIVGSRVIKLATSGSPARAPAASGCTPGSAGPRSAGCGCPPRGSRSATRSSPAPRRAGRAARLGSDAMEYRHLGRSGLKISEIAYGNWITHGSQVEEDAAKACVAAALDEGITTFDTADVYAGTKAEEILGRALHGVRRESLEISTKVYWPAGPGPNDTRPVPQAHHGVRARLAAAAADRLRRPVPGAPLRP